jgi:N-acyl homoserine lactone hydrolase
MAAVAAAFTAIAFAAAQTATGHSGQPPRSVRLYVFDGGTLHIADTGRFGLKKEEVATSDLSVACFLVAHPNGTLIWDTGAVPDTAWNPTGTAVTYHVVLPDSQKRDVTMIRPLMAQLAQVGYSPAKTTYLASRTTTTITPPTRTSSQAPLGSCGGTSATPCSLKSLRE